MSVNVWGTVGAVTGFLPLTALTGASGQLLGMNLAATAAEWKAATFLSGQMAVPTGSAAVPPYSFTGNLNMGVYGDTILNALSLTISGTRRFRVSDTLAAFEVPLRMESSVFSEEKSGNIVAAATTDLGTANGNYIYITNLAGNIIITRFGGVTLPAGTSFELKFKITAGSVTLKNDPNFLAVLGGTDLALFEGDVIRVRKTNDFDQFWEVVSYSKFQSLQITAVAQLPVTVIHPDINDRPAMVAGGWLPWNLNQQWGGAGCMPFHMIDSATGTEFKFDAFDGYIQDEGNTAAVGNAAGQFYAYQVITPAKNLSLQALWLKIFKTANPVDNVTVQLWSVAAGIPNALIATANVINGKQITSDTNGQWYRFSFAAVQALVAGTQYMIVASKSAGVDAANFYNWKGTITGTTKYPSNLRGVGTVVPAWTPGNTNSFTFLSEAQASDQPIQTAGTFDGRIIGNEGTPINRSVAWNKPLREFLPLFNSLGWSVIVRGKTWTKNKTIADFIYGIHHDRINIRCATATGFATVTLYDKTGTVTTLVGSSDVSAATYKDILICGRSLGDGADYLRIYTGIGNNWTKESEVVAQTFNLDPLMLDQGTGWIMGGFPLFSSATYTKLSDMTILPSADGWTFTTTTGTAEGNVFAVSNGKLNQIKSGMAAGGDGYYLKNAAGFSNVNGWFFASKVKCLSSLLTASTCPRIEFQDGAKRYVLDIQEYYMNNNPSVANSYTQNNFKDTDNSVFITGKGTDILVFVNGKLLVDDTSKLTTASGGNLLEFGDLATGANDNADVIWDYAGYYNTSNIYPQFTSGELHEFAVFPGEQGTLGQALYNGGAPISIKQYCGLPRNYVGSSSQRVQLKGITNQPTTGSTTPVVLPEMEAFVIGSDLDINTSDGQYNNTAGQWAGITMHIDGNPASIVNPAESISQAAPSLISAVVSSRKLTKNFGLHKIETRWLVSANTGTSSTVVRQLNIEAKA